MAGPGRPAPKPFPGRPKARKPTEDSATNPKTGRPMWDENAPDARDPGRSARSFSRVRGRGVWSDSTGRVIGTGAQEDEPMTPVAKYVSQRRAAGDKNYTPSSTGRMLPSRNSVVSTAKGILGGGGSYSDAYKKQKGN